MESANLHQLHQDHHQLLVGSSTLSTPCHSVGNSHSFPSNLLLNSSNIHTSSGENLGCHSWINDDDNNSHQYLGNYIKEEIKINSESSCSLPKFTDLLNNGNLLSRIQQENDNHEEEEEEEEQKQMNDLSEKLLLKTLLLHSPNYHVGGPFQSMGDSPSNVPFNANVGPTQIHPTVNISSLRNISSTGFPGISSMDMNLQPLDLFSMDRSSDESYSRLQHSLDPENLPWLNNNGPKRASNIVEPKPPQSVAKRQRADSRNSCPPFKVRKEKLGDRIAALQQMVAPFGKTDTASVLMEAIGYIKFLQNQVETLSVPYMKLSSRNRSNSSTMQEGSGKADLRSGGLCLVPLSCMSYITNDGGGGNIWPPHPHNFNPGF